MSEKISFPHMPEPQLASCSFKKGFFCSVPTLASLRIFRPGHGPPVTCPGRAVRWDFSSISRPGWFIWDNTNSQARPGLDYTVPRGTQRAHTRALLMKRAFFFFLITKQSCWTDGTQTINTIVTPLTAFYIDANMQNTGM